MTDDALDPRTVRELRRFADRVLRPIDAITIAEAAIARGRRRRASRTMLVLLGAAIVLAIYTGLRATLLFGGGLYLVALIVILATASGSRVSAHAGSDAVDR